MNDKQQLAAMGEHIAEQAEQAAQPLCMAKRIEELEAQVRVMAESLREAVSVLSSINHGGEHEVNIEGDEPAFWQRGEWVDWAKNEVLPKLQAALTGKLPIQVTPEGWQLVPHMPTPDMCAAFHRADSDWEDGWAFDGSGNRHHSPVYQWVAMLAAAPKPEAK